MDSVTVDNNNNDEGPRPPRSRGRRKDPLGPDGEIGSRLRALYSEVEQQPLPLELIELLERLSEVEAKAAK